MTANAANRRVAIPQLHAAITTATQAMLDLMLGNLPEAYVQALEAAHALSQAIQIDCRDGGALFALLCNRFKLV